MTTRPGDECPSAIVLVTLNARYIHTALGLRYLMANMGELQGQALIREFTLDVKPADIVERLLSTHPRIVGFGVYIWNISQTSEVVRMLKLVAPEVVVVLGGPEVSYEQDMQPIVEQADFVISGWGDIAFPRLCRQVISGGPPANKFIEGEQAALKEIVMPYRQYTDEDIKNRVVYVEASRGCPFRCEFCLSALDKTAWPFDVDQFLKEMELLYQRGARHFKFVDRTFNLKVANAVRILAFFRDRMDDELFVHFELIPDRLPAELKQLISGFPPGSMQFEIGIQSFNPRVQELVSRRQDNATAVDNIEWIRQHSSVHIHADLIFGLPGEDLESFAAGFDKLVALRPHEVQLGILKRLRGSPIVRHTQDYDLKFSADPPYNILSTDRVEFFTMQRVSRFSRYWDLIANSGRFRSTMPLLLGIDPFEQFLSLSDALYEDCGRTYSISLLRLFEAIYSAASRLGYVEVEELGEALSRDFALTGQKSVPGFMRSGVLKQNVPMGGSSAGRQNSRQLRHLGGSRSG